jgi:hypothetical protein
MGSGGNSFRGKISNLKNISNKDAIEYIKNNVKARFIDLENFDYNTIKQLEQISVWAYQPPLNFILKKFNFKQIDIVIED